MMRSKLLSIVVLPLVALTGCQQMERTGSAVGNFWNNLTGKTPLNAVKRMEDPYFADERRAGVNELSAKPFGRGQPYTARYQQIALTDKDFMVRVASIRALNRSRDASATSVFVRALDDENALVRTEAVKALSNLPDEAAIPKLIRMVNTVDEDRDVQSLVMLQRPAGPRFRCRVAKPKQPGRNHQQVRPSLRRNRMAAVRDRAGEAVWLIEADRWCRHARGK